MSGLIDRAAGRLQKASDATRDPADLAPASQRASQPASDSDSTHAGIPAGDNASVAASGPADIEEQIRTSTDAADDAPKEPAKTPAKRKKKPPARRRVGRPAGPARVALSVRILPRLDKGLTSAVDATGMSPQYIVEAALEDWLTRYGHLAPDE